MHAFTVVSETPHENEEEEEGPPSGDENEVGVSLMSGSGDPAAPAALVHKADRWGRFSFSATQDRGVGGGLV